MTFSYFLYNDSWMFKNRKSGTSKIGSIKTPIKDVRIKPSDGFSWIPTSREEELFERDSIFTGKDSSTVVQLSDGTKIALGQNSLISLVTKDGKLELNLKYGQVSADIVTTSKIQFKSGSETLELQKVTKPATVQFKKKKSGIASVKLVKGDLQTKKSNKVLSLPKEETVVMAPQEIKPLPTPIWNLKSPQDVKFYKNLVNNPVKLSWNSQNVESPIIEISPDTKFQSSVRVVNQPKPDVAIEGLDIGKYFWRLKGKDLGGKDVTSPIGRFSILDGPFIKITSPKNNDIIRVLVEKDSDSYKHPVKFEWESPFEKYDIDVSAQADFSKIILNQKSYSLKNITLALGNGEHHFRIRGLSGPYYSNWSTFSPVTLQILTKEKAKPPAPILLSTLIKYRPNLKRSPASIQPVNIRWKCDDKSVVKYIVDISPHDSSFKNPIRSTTSDTSFSFKPESSIKHFVRVYAISNENLFSNPSNLGEIKVELTPPELNPINPIFERSSLVDTQIPEANFQINWSGTDLAGSYDLEWSKEDSFKEKKILTSFRNQGLVKIPEPGSYYFRVKAIGTDRTIQSEYSPTVKSFYDFKKRLAVPSLIEPRNKLSVFLQKNIEPLIWLTWNNPNIGRPFELQISSDSDFKNVLKEMKIDKNKLLVKDRLPLGTVFWRVRQLSEDPSLSSDWSESRQFNLIHNRKEDIFR